MSAQLENRPYAAPPPPLIYEFARQVGSHPVEKVQGTAPTGGLFGSPIAAFRAATGIELSFPDFSDAGRDPDGECIRPKLMAAHHAPDIPQPERYKLVNYRESAREPAQYLPYGPLLFLDLLRLFMHDGPVPGSSQRSRGLLGFGMTRRMFWHFEPDDPLDHHLPAYGGRYLGQTRQVRYLFRYAHTRVLLDAFDQRFPGIADEMFGPVSYKERVLAVERHLGPVSGHPMHAEWKHSQRFAAGFAVQPQAHEAFGSARKRRGPFHNVMPYGARPPEIDLNWDRTAGLKWAMVPAHEFALMQVNLDDRGKPGAITKDARALAYLADPLRRERIARLLERKSLPSDYLANYPKGDFPISDADALATWVQVGGTTAPAVPMAKHELRWISMNVCLEAKLAGVLDGNFY